MGGDRNTVHLVTADGVESWPEHATRTRWRERLVAARRRAGSPSTRLRSNDDRAAKRARVRVAVVRLPHGARACRCPPISPTAPPAGPARGARTQHSADAGAAAPARWCRPASCSSCRAGFEAQVRPRSGLALHHGITVLNSPGTIDSDYRGEVMVLLANLGAGAVRDRAAASASPSSSCSPSCSAELSRCELARARGDGGFGSTGRFCDRLSPREQRLRKLSGNPARAERPPKWRKRAESALKRA